MCQLKRKSISMLNRLNWTPSEIQRHIPEFNYWNHSQYFYNFHYCHCNYPVCCISQPLGCKSASSFLLEVCFLIFLLYLWPICTYLLHLDCVRITQFRITQKITQLLSMGDLFTHAHFATETVTAFPFIPSPLWTDKILHNLWEQLKKSPNEILLNRRVAKGVSACGAAP